MTSANPQHFRNRRHAGALLGQMLRELEAVNPLVLGLLRGGVPVASEVARALNAPLDVWLVRKLGVPGQTELAFGAIAEGGVQVINQKVVAQQQLDKDRIRKISRQQQRELAHRAQLFRRARPPAPIRGRTVFLIDDGLATGASMRAAIQALAHRQPREIVPAVPVAPSRTIAELNSQVATTADGAEPSPRTSLVSRAIALLSPSPFWGVGAWYDDFRQVSNSEVVRILAGHARTDGAVQ
ncbi:MAG: phosphoribosyltransferase family protein [Caldilineaceae bacterium]|nr:phosphoribosyltransferase family protein [Caldilineaceae bacterium]MDE0337212.1 phosphoribosyltransferase family protein [Caldilineaceae bacterium]